MDGNILDSGEFEVMLSKGLGRYFAADEKQQLFQDAKTIADLLVAVMDRRTQELKEGKHQNPPHRRSPQRPKEIRRLAITTYPAFVRCSRYCKAWRRQIGQVILARLLRDVRNAFVRHPCAREGLLGQNFDLRYPRAVKRGRRKRGG